MNATAPPLSREEANLFNPAFLALLMRTVAEGHDEKSSTGLPWPLVYLALPTALHKPSRDALPRSTSTSMPAWTHNHPLAVASIGELAVSFQPLVRSSLLFGLAHGLVTTEGGALHPAKTVRRKRSAARRDPTDDFKACVAAARMLGRWYALSGLPSTIFALWGVRP